MSDRSASHAPSLTVPASADFSITPNDNLDLAETTRPGYIGIGGDLVVTMASGRLFPLPLFPTDRCCGCGFPGSMPPALPWRAVSG